MSTEHADHSEYDVVEEYCDRCETSTPHDVDVSLEREGDGEGTIAENEKYARTPVRVSVCHDCEATDRRQMA